MYSNAEHSKDIENFLGSIRQCMPDTAAVREALSFTRLVLEHPSPSGKMKGLRKSLLAIATRKAVEPKPTARQMRGLASTALSDCDNSTTGQVLEMALHALSVGLDDRPSARMLCVDLAMMAAGLKVIGIEDIVPAWEADGRPVCAMSPGPIRVWVAGHVARVCDALRGQLGSFEDWSPTDLECALLALRVNYCVFASATDGELGGEAELIEDFEKNGVLIWDALEQALVWLPSHALSAKSLGDERWHERARRLVRKKLGPSTPPTAQDPSIPNEPPTVSSGPTPLLLDGKPVLIVCRSPIVEASDRYDKEEVNRHKVLQLPLPLAVLPGFGSFAKMHRDLLVEFPWAVEVLGEIFDDLIGRAALGIQTFGFPPTLVVGQPGSGKSRLAGRLADVFGLPRMDLSLGGTGDTKVLGGTSRGWASGKPSDLATFLATRRSAAAMVILDELDKSTHGFDIGVGIQSFLLGMLEPQTSSRLMDPFLKTECDYSGVMWIATSNSLSGIQPALRSRLRILILRQPSPEHFHVIAEHVLRDLAKGWSLDRDVLPELKDLELPWDQLVSARQVRKSTEAAVMQWARELRRH